MTENLSATNYQILYLSVFKKSNSLFTVLQTGYDDVIVFFVIC